MAAGLLTPRKVLSDAAWHAVEARLEPFEVSWAAGLRPRIADHLDADDPSGGRLLVELVLTDLEYRLKAGEFARVEGYLAEFPRLREIPGAVQELAAAEFRLRKRAEPELEESEIRRRISEPTTGQTEPRNADRTEHDKKGPTSSDSAGSCFPVVAGYEIVGELGRGGMGVVYEAVEIRLKRTVALKTLRPGADGTERDRLRREAEAAAALVHPNVVPVHAVFEDAGRLYVASEYVPGGTLAARVAGAPLTSADAAAVLEPIARAVAYAHSHGIIHRDLKPQNVLLAADGIPKVADFGLAKRIGDDADATRTGVITGTANYMAPEQSLGRRGVGAAADVWALGAILYELLTGRPPFRGATALETLELVRSQEPVSPRRLVPRVRKDLETVCLKCLEKDPARRYRSASALADDLARFRRGEPVLAQPIGRIGAAARWAKRRPAVALLSTLLALSLSLGTAASLAFARRSALHAAASAKNERDAKQSADRARENARAATASERATKRVLFASDMLAAAEAITEADPSRAAEFLDGQRLEATGDAAFVWNHIDRLARAPGGEFDRFDGGGFAIAISPDLSTVAVGGGKGEFRLYSAGSWATVGRAIRTDSEPSQVRGLAFAPDGHSLFAAFGDGAVSAFSRKSGKEIWRTRPYDTCAYAVAPTFGGAAVVVCGDSPHLKVIDAATGEIRATLNTQDVAVSGIAISPDGGTLFAAGYRGRASAWDMRSLSEIWATDGAKTGLPRLTSVAVSPDGSAAAFGTTTAEALVVRPETWEADVVAVAPETVSADGVGSRSVGFLPDGRLVVGDDAGTVRVLSSEQLAIAKRHIPNVRIADDGARGLALLPDGRILAVGSAYSGRNRDAACVLYEADGTESPSFGAAGRLFVPLTIADEGFAPDEAFDVAVLPDGRAVAAGSTWNGSDYDVGLFRLTPDGTDESSDNAATGLSSRPRGLVAGPLSSAARRLLRAITPAGRQVAVNTEVDDWETSPDVAALHGGGHVVVWEVEGDRGGSSKGIRGRLFDRSGAPIGPDFRVQTKFISSPERPRVAALSDGGFVVVWQDFTPVKDMGWGIYARRFSSDGQPRDEADLTVDPHPITDQVAPCVAGLPDGGFVVAFHGAIRDGSSSGVFFRLYDASGSGGPQFRANTTTENEQSFPQVAAFDGGGFVLVWQSLNRDGDAFGIYGQLYDARGAKLGLEFQINGSTAGSQEDPSVAALGGGNFVVAWQSEGPDGGRSVFVRSFDRLGRPADFTERDLTEAEAGDWAEPEVAGLGDGGFAITYTGPDEDSSGIFVRRFDRAGRAVSDEVRINAHPAGMQAHPALAMRRDGEAFVTWSGTAPHDDFGISAVRIRDLAAEKQSVLPVELASPYSSTLRVVAGIPGGLAECFRLGDAASLGFDGLRPRVRGTPTFGPSLDAARVGIGGLDTGYGAGGCVTTQIGGGHDRAAAVAVTSDGKILAAGGAQIRRGDGPSSATFHYDMGFALARYNGDGSLDTTFGDGRDRDGDGTPDPKDGTVLTAMGPGDDQLHAVAVLPDGGIIACGRVFNGADFDFALAKYLPDGGLDPSFGSDGTISTPVGDGDDVVLDVALSPDGRIVVAGYSRRGPSYAFTVARYLRDGRLDPTFGARSNTDRINKAGIVLTAVEPGKDAYATAVTLSPAGEIVVSGYVQSGPDFNFRAASALARYMADGAPDTAFGRDGDGNGLKDGVVARFGPGDDDRAHAVAVLPDGRILVAGQASNGRSHDFFMTRFRPDGSLDPTFGKEGSAISAVSPESAYDVSGAAEAEPNPQATAGAPPKFSRPFWAAHPDRVTALAALTDGTVVTSSRDGGVAAWRPSGAPAWMTVPHDQAGNVSPGDWASEESTAKHLAVSRDRKIDLFDLDLGTVRSFYTDDVLDRLRSRVVDGRRVFAGLSQVPGSPVPGEAGSWGLGEDVLEPVWTWRADVPCSVSFGNLPASGDWIPAWLEAAAGATLPDGGQHAVALFDAAEGRIRASQALPERGCPPVVPADGSFVAVAAHTSVLLLEPATLAPRAELTGPAGWVKRIDVTDDGRRLAGCVDDGKVFLWDLQSDGPPRSWRADSTVTTSVAFSPDGSLLITVADRSPPRVWHVETGRLMFEAGNGPAHPSGGRTDWAPVSFSGDGTAAASGRGSFVTVFDGRQRPNVREAFHGSTRREGPHSPADPERPPRFGRGPVLRLPLEGTDPSKVGTPGAKLIGAVTETDPSPVQASLVSLSFQGPGSRIEVPFEVPNGEYALSLWFKTSVPTAGLFSVARPTQAGTDCELQVADGRIRARRNGAAPILAEGNFADGRWHHVVHMFGPRIHQRLYVDGEQVANGYDSAAKSHRASLIHLGHVSGEGWHLTGELDDVTVWDRPLSAEEIRWLASGRRMPGAGTERLQRPRTAR